jgi:adenine-specific DNA-methyltransferase
MPLLHWLTRDEDMGASTRAPYRLLEEVAQHSHGERAAGNMMIQGDNLDALKALLPYYAGKVKCIYIDPPYNTRSAFDHYDDNVEHAKWLSLMYPCLELLWRLLAENGSFWISIDDNEGHYLKVILDEICGRGAFVASNVWQKRYSRENREAIGDVHEYIHVYAKKPDLFKKERNLVPPTEAQAKVYRNPNNDPRGRWRPIPMTAQEGHATPEQFYQVISPSGKVHRPPQGRCWGISKSTYERLLAEGRIYFGKSGNSQPNMIRYLSEVPGMTPWTWWPSEEVGHTDESKKEIHALFGKTEAFASPKPERLMHRILTIATNPGDLVLDSFLGSGTTAAVAHKMGRRYIGVERGEQALTHCVPRLQKVIEGEQGGISELIEWQGGGGFRFYHLGVPVFDQGGQVSTDIRFAPLAAHLWFLQTGTPYDGHANSPFLGSYAGVGYYLLYDGILGDKSPRGDNILTGKVLSSLPAHDGEKVIFGEGCRLSAERLRAEQITFRQIPYEIRVR